MSPFDTKPANARGVVIPKGVELSVWQDDRWLPIGRTTADVRPAVRSDRRRTVWGLKRGRRSRR
jgi:hypothetical protein